jgi:hypothetical protein
MNSPVDRYLNPAKVYPPLPEDHPQYDMLTRFSGLAAAKYNQSFLLGTNITISAVFQISCG